MMLGFRKLNRVGWLSFGLWLCVLAGLFIAIWLVSFAQIGAFMVAIFPPDMLTALLRKALFSLWLVVMLVVIDNTFLSGFKTKEVLKTNALALAVLVGLFCVAVALS